MRIYTPAGDIPYRLFTFPDGQPHVELQANPEYDLVTIEAAIRNPEELLQLLLMRDVLDALGKGTRLDIRYLLGARMDRRINTYQPATLSVIAKHIRAAGFSKVRILDPHSEAALVLTEAKAVYPLRALRTVFEQYEPGLLVLAPDAGSTQRVKRMIQAAPYHVGVLQGAKIRNPQTGELNDFDIVTAPDLQGRTVLIMDDICDGGRTFTGQAEVLYKKGVTNVDLFVTHGVFSRGLPLHGIRHIWTTDSYTNPLISVRDAAFIRVIPIRMQDEP